MLSIWNNTPNTKAQCNDPQIILMFQRLLSLLIGSGFHQEDIASQGFGSHGALCQVTTAEVRHVKMGLHWEKFCYVEKKTNRKRTPQVTEAELGLTSTEGKDVTRAGYKFWFCAWRCKRSGVLLAAWQQLQIT